MEVCSEVDFRALDLGILGVLVFILLGGICLLYLLGLLYLDSIFYFYFHNVLLL